MDQPENSNPRNGNARKSRWSALGVVRFTVLAILPLTLLGVVFDNLKGQVSFSNRKAVGANASSNHHSATHTDLDEEQAYLNRALKIEARLQRDLRAKKERARSTPPNLFARQEHLNAVELELRSGIKRLVNQPALSSDLQDKLDSFESDLPE